MVFPDLANRNPGDPSSDSEPEEPGLSKTKKPRTRTTNSGGTSNSLVDFNDKLKFKELELEFTVDPLFKKTCADFDEGGPGGILSVSHLSLFFPSLFLICFFFWK